MASALPFHLIMFPLIMTATQASGVADLGATKILFSSSIALVLILLLVSILEMIRGRPGTWTAYAIVFGYGAWISVLEVSFGLWTTGLQAWNSTVVILVGLWFNQTVGLVAFLYSIALAIALVLAHGTGILAYAPILIDRTIDGQSNVIWGAGIMGLYYALFLYVFGLAWLTSTVLHRQKKELAMLSNTDHLTGISNRRHAESRLRQMVDSARDSSQPLSIALIDIDKFKAVNDGYSHAAGDAVLSKVADCMRSHSRPSDLIARVGGDELLMAFPGTGARASFLNCQRLRQAVSELRFNDHAPDLRVTISVGISDAPEEKFENIIKRADKALYECKSLGRNRVSIDA